MKKNKILIINPALPIGKGGKSCIAPLYLGNSLKKAGYDVVIADGTIDADYEKLSEKNSDAFIAGFSVMTTQIEDALRISSRLRELNPKIKIVWGGPHPTIDPKNTVMHPLVDFAVVGEGEQTFVDIAGAVKKGKNGFSKIRGIAFKDGKKVTVTEFRDYLDPNALRPIDWSIVDVEKYIYDDYDTGERCIWLSTGRGCVYNCNFCINTILAKKKWRPVSAENILLDLDYLIKNHGIKSVYFNDENFFIQRNRVIAVCKGIIDRGYKINWMASGRCDYFNESHINDEVLGLMKKSGCNSVRLGVESGSENVLKFVRKGVTIEQIKRSVSDLGRYKITPIGLFMMGLPTETREDIIATMKLITELKEINPLMKIVGPQLFRPYFGSELFNYLEKYDFRAPDSLEGWVQSSKHQDALFEGFIELEKMPWIEDPKFVGTVLFYAGVFQFQPQLSGSGAKKIFFKIIYPVAFWRMKHGIYGFSIEKSLYEAGLRIRKSMKK